MTANAFEALRAVLDEDGEAAPVGSPDFPVGVLTVTVTLGAIGFMLTF
jgi:hypothetical protein